MVAVAVHIDIADHWWAEIIEYITASMTLLPGDIVSTGSPAGTAPMVPGDYIEIEIPGIGRLGNPVERA